MNWRSGTNHSSVTATYSAYEIHDAVAERLDPCRPQRNGAGSWYGVWGVPPTVGRAIVAGGTCPMP